MDIRIQIYPVTKPRAVVQTNRTQTFWILKGSNTLSIKQKAVSAIPEAFFNDFNKTDLGNSPALTDTISETHL